MTSGNGEISLIQQKITEKACLVASEGNSGGSKADLGKVPMELLSPIAITELAKVLQFGAKKYSKHNWRKGIVYSRILAAILRHVFAYLDGESKDPETGLSHAAHAMAECMFLLEFEATQPHLDDRYKSNSDNATCPSTTLPPLKS